MSELDALEASLTDSTPRACVSVYTFPAAVSRRHRFRGTEPSKGLGRSRARPEGRQRLLLTVRTGAFLPAPRGGPVTSNVCRSD